VVERLEQRYGEAVSEASSSVVVDAPPERVWEVVSDPRNLPKWDRHIVDVEGVPPGGLEKGIRYTTTLRFMGFHGVIDAEVLDVDPPRSSTIRLSGFMEATVRTRVKSVGSGRSELRHDVEYGFRGGPLGMIAEKGLRMSGGPSLMLRRGALAQKRQIEGG
jgi:uncharacterized protein YndB with AHSA1/START domain